MKKWGPWLVLLLAATACSSTDDPPEGKDATITVDAGVADNGVAVLPDAETFPDAMVDGGAADSGVVIGEVIVAPAETWTWVDFPESACDDGSPTGIGVNTSSTSSNLILFFNGGGACWDYMTCFELMTAAQGPFGAPQLQQATGALGGSIFDRADAANIFRDWNMVFIPYCTGDTHAGDGVTTYERNGGQMRDYYHTGRKNFLAFVQRIAATFPAPGKLVVSGSSAGGFGATWNYSTVRAYWPTGQVYLIDDSGPALGPDAVDERLRETWINSWNLGPILDQTCGIACAEDFSLAYRELAMRYPNDRMALLSSLQDQVIRQFLQVSGGTFEGALLRMSTEVLDPLPNFKYFFIGGSSHTMLGSPDDYDSVGMNLWTWMADQINDDANWESRKP